MNEEILSGIKLAKARGYSVEEAARSFINAGYNPSEVQEAATYISRGFSPFPQQVAPAEEESPVSSEAVKGLSPSALEKYAQPGASRTMIISLIILAIIVVSLGLTLILFKDQLFG